MWTLQNLLFSLCIALRCVTSAVGVIHVTGYVGRKVNVSCSYDRGYESHEKYLCKNGCGSSDVLITTSRPVKNKYSIHDNKTARIFTTAISDLHSVDAGTYWCGVSKSWKDIYTEVKLKLVQDSCCEIVTKIQSYERYSVSISCPYASQYQNNLKYICRGNRPSTCLQQALITSEKKQNGRFRLDENVLRDFTVTIINVSQNDSGPYLFGVQSNSDLDVFTAVELEVQEWCCIKSTKINGTVGHPLTLQCPYPPQHRDNRKFLCKGEHHNNCTDMLTTSERRFTLQDNATSSSFLVRFTELEAADAGTYWCGSDPQWTVENYTKIELSVFLQHTSAVNPFTTVETLRTNITGSALYVVYTVPPVLLLTCVLVIVYKYRRSRGKEADNTMSRNTAKAKSSEEVVGATGCRIYENQEAVMTNKQQSDCNHHEDAGRDDENYENLTTTEEIYCNENFHKTKRR